MTFTKHEALGITVRKRVEYITECGTKFLSFQEAAHFVLVERVKEIAKKANVLDNGVRMIGMFIDEHLEDVKDIIDEYEKATTDSI
jgi:hypothetical protein